MSDYAVELLAELGKRAAVRVFRPPNWRPSEDWSLDGIVEMVDASTEAERDEITLIHIGNNPHHLWLLSRLGGPRTVVVLHDLVLHHLLVEATVGVGDGASYERRLSSSYGGAGRALAEARTLGLSGVQDPFLYPARASFLDSVEGVVVHSSWAEAIIRSEFPGLSVARVPLSVLDPGRVEREIQRAKFGISDNEVMLMHLGFLTPGKGLGGILGGLGAAVTAGVPARLVMVGEESGGQRVAAAAEAVGLADHIVSTGWIDAETLPLVPAAADLGVVLRTPSAGETSAAALRFLACGTPVAVGGLRQFLEWPEAAAPRITPGPPASADLARLLAQAAAGGKAWSERRLAARATYEARHRPGDAADQLLSFLKTV
ncbi:MAG: hypothetical protein ACC742_00865 [Thermoanaerobaculales bacterium]